MTQILKPENTEIYLTDTFLRRLKFIGVDLTEILGKDEADKIWHYKENYFRKIFAYSMIDKTKSIILNN